MNKFKKNLPPKVKPVKIMGLNKAKKSCCGKREEPKEISPKKTAAKIKQEVKGRYDEFAKEGGSAESCCPLVGGSAEGFALKHGLYSQVELALIPKLAINLSRG